MGHDELGRVVSRTLNGVTSTWAYDQQGRLTTLGDPIGNFTYAYVGNSGRVQTVTYPNGQTSSYSYLPVNQDLRLQQIHHRKPDASTLNKFDYTYDVLGNIKTWTQQTDANPAQIYEYEYDRADQLEFATLKSTGGSVLKRYRYDYDPAGNRAIEQIDDAASLSTFDNMNRLVTQVPGGALSFRGTVNEPASVTVATKPAFVTAGNQFTGSAPVTSGTTSVAVKATDPNGNIRTNTYQVNQTGASKAFTYDPNGNLTGDGTKTYIWDGADRLVEVKQGATSLAALNYNGHGLRGNKIIGAASVTYIHEGSQVIEERPSAGSTTRYVYGPGIDRPLARVIGATTSYNVADHLGSVARTTNSAGSPTSAREYDPWGNQVQGSVTSGYSFTGREWDAETGLYYYRLGYYSSELGRFVGEDPAAAESDQTLYSYARNNALNRADPLGLQSQSAGWPVTPRPVHTLAPKADPKSFCNEGERPLWWDIIATEGLSFGSVGSFKSVFLDKCEGGTKFDAKTGKAKWHTSRFKELLNVANLLDDESAAKLMGLDGNVMNVTPMPLQLPFAVFGMCCERCSP